MGVLAGKLSVGRKGIVRRQPASVRRPHRGGDNARPPAAAVVYLDALRTAPFRLAAHPICQRYLRHAEAPQARRAGATSVRRVTFAIASGCPFQCDLTLAYAQLTTAAAR